MLRKKHKLTRSSLNDLLKSELTVFLDYEKWEYKGYGSGNSRNGFYQRNLKTKFGKIDLKIPRDRAGQFKQQTIKAYSRNTDNLENMIITLYKKVITTREIAELLEKMYGTNYSPTTISNISKDAKEIYRSDYIKTAEKRLEEFLTKWSGRYPKLRKLLERKDNLFTFMLFPKEIRRSLYTNNICENFNKDTKRKLKQKVQFPNEENLDKGVYIIVSEYNNKFSARTHLGFGLVKYELEKMIEQVSDSTDTIKSKKTYKFGFTQKI